MRRDESDDDPRTNLTGSRKREWRIGAENDQDAHDGHSRRQAPVDDVQQGIVSLEDGRLLVGHRRRCVRDDVAIALGKGEQQVV